MIRITNDIDQLIKRTTPEMMSGHIMKALTENGAIYNESQIHLEEIWAYAFNQAFNSPDSNFNTPHGGRVRVFEGDVVLKREKLEETRRAILAQFGVSRFDEDEHGVGKISPSDAVLGAIGWFDVMFKEALDLMVRKNLVCSDGGGLYWFSPPQD